MANQILVWPGSDYPLGATYDGIGTNFSLFSEMADRVELCLFDGAGKETHIELPENDGFCWHGYLPGIGPGQRYGFRVHGPWEPATGKLCCPSKLLLDPYAKAVEGSVKWHDSLFPSQPDKPDAPPDTTDSAPFMPRSVIINPFFDWSKDRSPDIPMHDTIIYEVHVKGFTFMHPGIPEQLRGTYAGLAHHAAIEYLAKLGVTAVELMPVQQFVHSRILVDRGVRNYWGYDPIAYLAPHNEYSSTGDVGQQVQEFKQMVLRLHEAGIEVILDVVFNHTAEGNHFGPVLCYKGIDNHSYYRLTPDKRYYEDFTGTGNSLNMRHPQVLRLVMESLRYWVTDMHVDGFRFDLAATLARELYAVDRLSTFFSIIHQDPVISKVKLIAEPWDVGEGGYQVGEFPPRWSELNGKYRDSVRDFWKGTPVPTREIVTRFMGSQDLYEKTGRRPYASVNFVTSHDGFTLMDLVSYNDKHNEANLENNADGNNDNRSWNCGVEGPTDNPEVNALRARQQRNFLTTLLLSQGLPLLRAGSESGHTQGGNNNAYCQDNRISWQQWDCVDKQLRDFTAMLIQLRKEHPVLHRWKRYQHPGRGDGGIRCFWPGGNELTEEEWTTGKTGPVLIHLSGVLNQIDNQGVPIQDRDVRVILNAEANEARFVLPPGDGGVWIKVVDTDLTPGAAQGQVWHDGDILAVPPRSMVVLCREA